MYPVPQGVLQGNSGNVGATSAAVQQPHVLGGVDVVNAHNNYLATLVADFEAIADHLNGAAPPADAPQQQKTTSGTIVGAVHEAAAAYGDLVSRLSRAGGRIRAALHG